MSINNLLKALSQRESSAVVFNQYRDKDILNNLNCYFEYILKRNNRLLFIGEAPGYKGCRLTGIPFTSGKVISNSRHKIFRQFGFNIVLSKIASESTATILWEYLDSSKSVPILWNAFPFHPHKKGQPETNRKPDALEIEEGKRYLKLVYDLFKPKMLCSLGRIGERILKEVFPEEKVLYIRHPSHGGKSAFISGIQKVYLKGNQTS